MFARKKYFSTNQIFFLGNPTGSTYDAGTSAYVQQAPFQGSRQLDPTISEYWKTNYNIKSDDQFFFQQLEWYKELWNFDSRRIWLPLSKRSGTEGVLSIMYRDVKEDAPLVPIGKFL